MSLKDFFKKHRTLTIILVGIIFIVLPDPTDLFSAGTPLFDVFATVAAASISAYMGRKK